MFAAAGGAEIDIVDEDATPHTVGCNNLEFQFMVAVDSGQHHAARAPVDAGESTQRNLEQLGASYPDFKVVTLTAARQCDHEELETYRDRI